MRKDGTRFWSEGTLSPQADAAGKILGFVKVIRDGTNKKLSAEQIADDR